MSNLTSPFFIVAVYGLKLESRNWGKMKQVYGLDVYKLAEELSDTPDLLRF